ncbi:MAG: hypothetical protein MR038_01825 [Oscillospiraceae bacterium]|nr:hypothetical protein [Oscillospiraceae bacterium]
MNDNENISENTETTEDITENEKPGEEVELNDEGQPRPPVDPRNGLYTFLSLLIFAVCYVGYHFISINFFTPYYLTKTEFTAAEAQVLESTVNIPLPENAVISYGKLGSGVDGDRLHIRYSGIGDEEAFIESAPFDCIPVEEEVRVSIFRDETADVDYVFADTYTDSADPSYTLIIYEYGGTLCAEYIRSDYDKPIRNIFKNGEKFTISN